LALLPLLHQAAAFVFAVAITQAPH